MEAVSADLNRQMPITYNPTRGTNKRAVYKIHVLLLYPIFINRNGVNTPQKAKARTFIITSAIAESHPRHIKRLNTKTQINMPSKIRPAYQSRPTPFCLRRSGVVDGGTLEFNYYL
jgi:hypothetical protein